MLAHRLMGSSGGGGAVGPVSPVSCTFTDSSVSTADSTAYTFSSQDFGEAAANRYIVVTAGGYDTGNETVSSITIGGVAATIAVQVTGNFVTAAIAIAKVPTGATGDVVVTFSGGMQNAGIGVYRLINLQSATATDTGTDIAESSGALADGLTIPADGCGIGYVCVRTVSSLSTFSWTNLTESFDQTIENITFSRTSHSGAISSTAGTATRTATASVSLDNEAMVLAAWR